MTEVVLNDLLVCLSQEQTKVEKLSTRLAELGEDVHTLFYKVLTMTLPFRMMTMKSDVFM